MHEFDKRSTVLFVLTKGKYFNSAKIIFIERLNQNLKLVKYIRKTEQI